MIQKLGLLLGSIRFWGITIIAIAAIFQGHDVGMTIDTWLAAVVALGTLDSVANKVGGETTNSVRSLASKSGL